MGMTLLMILALAAPQVDDKAVAEAMDRFKKGMANPNASARAAAIAELSRTPHDKTFKAIVPFLSSDVKDVRKAAAKAMVQYADWKKLATPMLMSSLGGVNTKEHEVKVEIFGALGKLQDPVAVPTVHGAFKEDDVRVARAAIAAAGEMRLKESIDPLVDLLKDIQKWLKNKQSGPYRDEKGQQGDENACKGRLEGVQAEIIKALKGISLERWSSPQEWEIWWNKRKNGYEVPPEPEKKDKK